MKDSIKKVKMLLRFKETLLPQEFYPAFLEALRPEDVDEVLAQNSIDLPELRWWVGHLTSPEDPKRQWHKHASKYWCLKKVEEWLNSHA